MSHTIKPSLYMTTTPTGLYEANYRRLTRLIPDIKTYAKKESIELNASKIDIIIIEQFKYTTVIELKQALQASARHFSSIDMEIRICHDANLVEVIGYQGKSPIQSALVYPNKHMLQVDEKKQLNLLLKDILENAIKMERQNARSISPCN